jgi:putative holliday junction resolvase
VILGIDPGTRRVGVAIADEETRLARPLEVIDVTDRLPIKRIADLVKEHAVREVVVGRPLSLSGEAGAAVAEYATFVDELRQDLASKNVPLIEYDERFTSLVADRSLREAGVKGRKRRKIVDAVAAQVMLQGYLDATRSRS